MPREDISFKTTDGTTLRGWFYPPTEKTEGKTPCLILSHGFTAIKEQGLDDYAESFQAEIPSLNVLVYDHRGLGDSDAGPNQIRTEIDPLAQVADISDAITYAQLRPEVDAAKIGIWGSSNSGGHVILSGAQDRRVKLVISQVPHLDGVRVMRRLMKGNMPINAMFEADRHARAQGKEPAMMPVIAPEPHENCVLPMKDAYDFFSKWDPKATEKWKNHITLRTVEYLRNYRPGLVIDAVSPTPLLMVVAESDSMMTPTDLCLEFYAKAREPKELMIIPGDHFDVYFGEKLKAMKAREVEFMRKWLFRE